MLSGIYSAATALTASERNQEVVAHNLAHMNVPGFRRSVLSFETFDSKLQQTTAEAPQGHGSFVAMQMTDHTSGPIVETSRPLDVAISGDGFFVIEGDDGPLYTRNGVFHIDAESGNLVTSDGRNVSGDGGPIGVPGNATPGQITISSSGELLLAGEPFGQLELVQFEDVGVLIPEGTTLFSAPNDAVFAQGDVVVRQGAREQSNVSPVNELVQMIVAMRYHEAAQKALRSIDDAIHQQTNPGA